MKLRLCVVAVLLVTVLLVALAFPHAGQSADVKKKEEAAASIDNHKAELTGGLLPKPRCAKPGLHGCLQIMPSVRVLRSSAVSQECLRLSLPLTARGGPS